MFGSKPKQPQKTAPAVTMGPVHKVPCPHCKQPMDFRAHVSAEDGGAGWGDQVLETGVTIDCDHCDGQSKLLGKEKIVMIKLAPI
jgi:hypothetical protein